MDFEDEIYNVLKALDFFFEQLPNVAKSKHTVDTTLIFNKDIKNIVHNFLQLTDEKFNHSLFGVLSPAMVDEITLRDRKEHLLNKLKKELDTLNECLRLYLLNFVEPIKCDGYSNQIKELGDVKLLNFNYTYTYKKVYGNLIKMHHPIHGNCLNGGMVLGIPDDSFCNKLEYIYFVKYFQRIQKKAGSFYKEWIQRPFPQTLSDAPCNVYIMGHSLAVTDKGVLKYFLKNEWVIKITIFYHSQNAYEDMVINLVRMFDKDFVIEQIGNGRIEFVNLEDPVKSK